MTDLKQFDMEELELLNLEFRRPDKRVLLSALDDTNAAAADMDLKAVADRLKEKIEPLTDKEIRDLFLQFPVEPYFADSLYG